MGLRFQRSIKIFPGLRINLSKSGIGVSAGVRGFHVGISSTKRPYVSAGIPGTGLSVREYAKHQDTPTDAPEPAPQPSAAPLWIVAGLLLGGGILIALLLASR